MPVEKVLLPSTSNANIRRAYTDGPHGQIHYWTAGKGEALLLIHQSSSSQEEYSALVPYLKDIYFLIAFDWPGHGNSDDPPYELGVESYTESALHVLNHLGINRCQVLGHHGGALLAMNLAYTHPERVHKVILSGSSGLKDEKEATSFRDNLPVSKEEVWGAEGELLLSAWKRYINYLPETSPKQVLIPFINKLLSRIRPYDAHHAVLKWDRRPALMSLKDKPVLLFQGSLDHFVSKQEQLLEILPLAERQVIEGAGPFLFFDKAEACAEIIRNFLSKP